MEDLLKKELNPAQYDAVTYSGGPSLVIAGAGSGKTRVLTYKIAYLLQSGIYPWQILALTFTNKAAREMLQRIGSLVGEEEVRHLWAGTFHSIFSRLLHIEADRLGYENNFTIYDTSDSKSLLKTIIKEFGLDEKKYKANLVAARISDAKNRLILPNVYVNDNEIRMRDKRDELVALGNIYVAYQQRLKQSNAMDFDDLLLQTFLLLNNFPDLREKYQKRFPFILVDEYQDTNYAQYRIIRLLAPETADLCVVGDDAQSIYGFRGADLNNILGFQKDYPTTRLIKLEQNYRSTQNIVDAANSIIRKNKGQIPKNVFSNNEVGKKLQLLAAYSDKEESLKVAKNIRMLRQREGFDFNQIAVLYRTNAQSRSFEEAFTKTNLPYRVYGGLSFYQRKEIKDLIAYLRLTINLYDEEAARRIINYPARGIGKSTIEKIQEAAANNTVRFWDVLCNPLQWGATLNARTLGKLQSFTRMISSFCKAAKEMTAYDLAQKIWEETGMMADIKAEDAAENLARTENVEEFLNSIRNFEMERTEERGETFTPINDFVAQVSLLTDQDHKETDEPKITLMTIHSAKGLEYDVIFVTGLEEDLFPNSLARFSPREMEEERRLFYVAVTRAKKQCFLTYAKSRIKFGKFEYCEPSIFLEEIDKQYITEEDASSSSFADRPKKAFDTPQFKKPEKAHNYTSSRIFSTPKNDKQLTPLFSAASNKTPTSSAGNEWGISVGSIIEHNRFGKGTVISMEGSGSSTKALVEFEFSGTKNLLLKFAKFRKL